MLTGVRAWIAGGVGVVVLALAGAALWWRAEAATARAAAETARQEAMALTERLRANDAALAALREERDRTVRVLEAAAAEMARRADRLLEVRRAVDAAPRTTACVDSPAVRAALDGLRDGAASGRGPGGAGGGASEPAAMSEAAGPAGSPVGH